MYTFVNDSIEKSDWMKSGKELPILAPTKKKREKGGAGSGHHGHAGRPGLRGGSAPGKGGATMGGAPNKGGNILGFMAEKPSKNIAKVYESNKMRALFENTTPSEFFTGMQGVDPESGFRVELDDIVPSKNGAYPHAFYVVKDKDGGTVGEIILTCSEDSESGEKFVRLDSLDLEVKRTGFGSAWVENFERRCFDSGFDSIQLHANMDIGGYYWAKMGYDLDFQNQDVSQVLDTFHGLLAIEHDMGYKGKPFELSMLHPSINDSDDFLMYAEQNRDTMQLIANFKRADGESVGKKALLGSHWLGVKRVFDESVFNKKK